MRQIDHIHLPTDIIPATLGNYAHIVKAGGFIHICGIGARSAETGKEVGLVVDDANQVSAYDIAVQTQQVLETLKAALASEGCNFSHLVDLTVFLRDMRDFLKYNQVYNEYFNGEHIPARTTVEGSPPGKSYILLKAIAYKPY